MNSAIATTTSTQTPAQLARARQAALSAQLPLVWKVARQIARRLPSSVDVAELVGAGTIGLMDAMERYEVQRCDRFGAYAEIRIRGAILDQLREMDWMPRAARTKRKRLESTASTLQHKLGRAPDASELAEALGTSVEGMEKMRRDVHAAERAKDVDVESGDVAVDGKASPLDNIADREQRVRLTAAIAALPERHQQVLSLYYIKDLKLREVGDLLGVTESRVCQVLKDVVARLRTAVIDD
jgi:RNA polymerase sigma factor for flagellar operon FliA